MPLYEYKCSGCGQVFEVIQRFSDEPLTKHEACGGDVERLLSAPAFQFKGSGWYVTDYAKGNGGGPAKNGGNSKSETKTETKADSSSSTSSSTSTDKK